MRDMSDGVMYQIPPDRFVCFGKLPASVVPETDGDVECIKLAEGEECERGVPVAKKAPARVIVKEEPEEEPEGDGEHKSQIQHLAENSDERTKTSKAKAKAAAKAKAKAAAKAKAKAAAK